MPVCGDCGKIISQKRWRRHKSGRCSKLRMAKVVSRDLGATTKPRSPEADYKEEVFSLLKPSIILTLGEKGGEGR